MQRQKQRGSDCRRKRLQLPRHLVDKQCPDAAKKYFDASIFGKQSDFREEKSMHGREGGAEAGGQLQQAAVVTGTVGRVDSLIGFLPRPRRTRSDLFIFCMIWAVSLGKASASVLPKRCDSMYRDTTHQHHHHTSAAPSVQKATNSNQGWGSPSRAAGVNHPTGGKKSGPTAGTLAGSERGPLLQHYCLATRGVAWVDVLIRRMPQSCPPYQDKTITHQHTTTTTTKVPPILAGSVRGPRLQQHCPTTTTNKATTNEAPPTTSTWGRWSLTHVAVLYGYMLMSWQSMTTMRESVGLAASGAPPLEPPPQGGGEPGELMPKPRQNDTKGRHQLQTSQPPGTRNHRATRGHNQPTNHRATRGHDQPTDHRATRGHDQPTDHRATRGHDRQC